MLFRALLWYNWHITLCKFNVYDIMILYILCLVTQLYPTLCNPMDCSPPGSSVRGDSPGKDTGISSYSSLHEAFHPSAESPFPGHPRTHSDWKQHQLGRWLLHSAPWALSRQGLQSIHKISVQVATPIDIQWISTTVMKEVATRGQYQRVWRWIALTSSRGPCRAQRNKRIQEMKGAHSTVL